MASSHQRENQDNLILLASRKRLASSGISNVLVCATGGVSKIAQVSGTQVSGALVSFDRRELNILLNIYSMKVAKAQWRDYAIDCLAGRAIFSIFKRTGQKPLFQVEKNPKLTSRQGAYSVIAQDGRILKRGNDLQRVLRVLDNHLRVVG